MTDHRFEEVKLFMPSGQVIAGKWYGNKSIRPILCLHGVEDNAGTFDRLIPMLPETFSYLAVDLPGHGRSSWIPHGQQYKIMDLLFTIDFIYRHYRWDKISFITHSISSRLAFLYASMYPDRVDLMIFIDVLKPSVCDTTDMKNVFHKKYEKFLLINKQNQQNTEPPSYTLDEMAERIVQGTFKSVTKEAAHYLLNRNTIPSRKYPGKFYFARDRRLQSRIPPHIPQDVQLELALKLKMPLLYIRVSDSTYAKIKELQEEDEVIKVLEQHPKFQFYVVKSMSHHVHLTEPEKIIPIINEFLNKNLNLKGHL